MTSHYKILLLCHVLAKKKAQDEKSGLGIYNMQHGTIARFDWAAQVLLLMYGGDMTVVQMRRHGADVNSYKTNHEVGRLNKYIPGNVSKCFKFNISDLSKKYIF